ncbi:hypothetical protein EDB84DRAFT_1553914, partial [Lactarius hengduanensis]
CTKVNAQRKFVDLINEATFKWANWDPPRVIQKSGELKVEGNIFTHPEIWHIAQDYPVLRRLDIQADVGARWQFNTKRGAILLMHKPRYSVSRTGVLSSSWMIQRMLTYIYLPASQRADLSFLSATRPGVDGEQALFVGWSADGSSGVCQQEFREDAVTLRCLSFKSLGRRHWRRDGIIPMIEK